MAGGGRTGVRCQVTGVRAVVSRRCDLGQRTTDHGLRTARKKGRIELMNAIEEKQGLYLSSFNQFEESLAARAPSWLHEIRRTAIESFAEKGFPTTRQEEWRNTNVAPIAAVPFQPAATSSERGHPARTTAGRMPALRGGASLAERISQLPLADLGCPRLVFINGRFSKQLSTLDALPHGVKAGSLAEALASDGNILKSHLTRYATDYTEHAFVALNTAFLEDGAFVEIPRGAILDKPIYLLYVSEASGFPTVSYPRNLIITGRESQATIIEGYVGPEAAPLFRSAGARSMRPEGIYFTNAVTEIAVGE